MGKYFNEAQREKIKDIADSLEEKYGIQDVDFQKCLKFLFETTEQNTDENLLDKIWSVICTKKSRADYISSLFDDFCSEHGCSDCIYGSYDNKGSCRVAFTLDYVEDDKRSAEDN